jgi:hypothetical protein
MLWMIAGIGQKNEVCGLARAEFQSIGGEYFLM